MKYFEKFDDSLLNISIFTCNFKLNLYSNILLIYFPFPLSLNSFLLRYHSIYRSPTSMPKSTTSVANCKWQFSPLGDVNDSNKRFSLSTHSVKPTLKKVSKYENKFAKLQKKAAEFNFRNQLKVVKKKEFTLEEEDKEVSVSLRFSYTFTSSKTKFTLQKKYRLI